ncbi:MAG: YceH family protein [Phycisphaerales bacterium]|nr:YceH family protein [Phycisphaerales bacterium]
MVTSLNENERRVLGSLMEKSMAQPDYYPMTENALVAACNQKQNRDPVMDLDGDDIWNALESLRTSGLVGMVLPAPGARSKRFKHEAETHFGWHKRERAIMTELLLRGPQTVGELRTRCSRFVPFDDLEAVTIVLDNLAQLDQPMVAALPREPGRSAIRYTHLLYPEGETPAIAPASESTHASPTVHSAPPVAQSNGTVQQEIENLQSEVAELHETLADFRKRLEAIESQLL